MAVNSTQGVVLAIFGASAGGHLTALDANANANGLASLAEDLSAAAGLILGVDLSSNSSYTSTVLDNLGVVAGDARTAAEAYFTSQLAAGASRGAVTAAAVEYLLSDGAAAPYDAVAATFRTTVTEAVTWSQGAGANTFSVAQLRAQQDNTAVDGNSFAFTSSADSFTLTAGNDVVTAASGTMASGDIVLDGSSNDADVLTATVNSSALTTRIQNVETINLNGASVVTGMDLVNVLGASTVNVDTALRTGTATITNASSLATGNIVAGDNVRTVSVTATASGTRDAVTVDTNDAAVVTVAGAAGADTFVANLAADASGTFQGGGSVDEYTVTLGGDATYTGDTTTENLTIVYSGADQASVTLGANEMTADYATATDYGTTIQGSGDIKFTGTALAFDAKKIVNSGTGTITVDITDATVAADYSEVAVDLLELSTTAAGNVLVRVNPNTVVNLDADHTAIVTLNNADDTDTANAGSVAVNISESQTAALTPGDEIGTLILEATPDSAADTASGAEISLTELDIDTNGTSVVLVRGDDNLTITLLDNNGAGDIISATEMTGELTIDDTEAAATIVLGQGNDEVKDTVDSAVTLVYGGDGNDTITVGASAANKLYGEAGDDTLNGGSGGETIEGGTGDDTIDGNAGADTISGGDGADEVDGGAGADTISVGAGADTVVQVTAEDGDTVSDFDIAEDTLILTGATNAAIDLSDITITDSVHLLDGAGGNFEITLTGVTATDVSAFVQLGRVTEGTAANGVAIKNAEVFDSFVGSNDNIDGGAKNDVIEVGDVTDTGAITTGAGNDIIVAPVAATGVLDINDFEKGVDRLVFEGTLAATIDVSSVTVSSGQYTFDTNAIVNLANAGSNLTATDMSDSVQLGTAATAVTAGGAGTFEGGQFNDYMAGDAGTAQVFNFIDNGGVDVITVFTTGEDDLNFDSMAEINGDGIDVAADAAKISDAIDGEIYVFADGSDGTGSESIDFNGSGNTSTFGDADVLADVAQFLDAGLGASTGEHYVAVISTAGSTLHAIYLIEGDADGIDADDLTLLGQVTTAANALLAADIS